MSTTRLRRKAAAVLTSAGLSGAALVGAASTAQAIPADPPANDHGCPSGAVCIYDGDGWWENNPTHAFYSYGVHRFYGQYGEHRVFNNQYGDAWVAFSPDGTRWASIIGPGVWDDVNLTNYNMLELSEGA